MENTCFLLADLEVADVTCDHAALIRMLRRLLSLGEILECYESTRSAQEIADQNMLDLISQFEDFPSKSKSSKGSKKKGKQQQAEKGGATHKKQSAKAKQGKAAIGDKMYSDLIGGGMTEWVVTL